tara:strand:+ start:4396 stop:5625 length:1230 start_codon:yes stop_codon:yes gene_type:complete
MPRPYPAIIRGGAWEHKQVPYPNAATGFNPTQVLYTPTGTSSGDRFARVHEALHVKFSPKRQAKGHKKIEPWAYQLGEDWRIHQRGNFVTNSQDYEDGIEALKPLVSLDVPPGMAIGQALALCSIIRSTNIVQIGETIERLYQDAYAKAKPEQKQAFTIAVADKLGCRIFGQEPAFQNGYEPWYQLNDSKPSSSVKLGEWLQEDPPQRGDQYEFDEDPWAQGETPELRDDDDQWGSLRINEPERTERVSEPKVRGKTYDQEGTLPVAWHRYPLDGAVFKRRARKKWDLALLVDASGSMSWDREDLYETAKAGSLVAMYSGSGRFGDLAILSMDGLAVTMKTLSQYKHGGNCVDGPALQWLAEQDAKRKVWLSDEGVTGRTNLCTPKLLRDCRETCARARIRRIERMRDL